MPPKERAAAIAAMIDDVVRQVTSLDTDPAEDPAPGSLRGPVR